MMEKNYENIVNLMKKIVILVFILFLIITVESVAQTAEKLEIAAGGKSPYAIVVADNADPGRIKISADLLQKTIKQACGVLLPIIKESKLKEGTPAIYLGKTKGAKKAGLPVDEIQGWAYLYKAVGPNIFIVGDDASDDIKDSKTLIEHLGTLKGVIAFLEDQLGARFLIPGAYGFRIPEQDPLTVDAGMNKSWKTRFDFVTGRAPKDRKLAVALNLFGKNPVLKTYGGHSYYDAVPAKKYAKTNPEYFILKGGRRTAKGNHLCISNPEVQELMLKEMEKQLDNGYQMVELAQTDGYQECQCEECRKIHPESAERIWIIHRKLAEEMKKRRPGKKVMLLSYGPTVVPPKTFRDFPDNVVIQMCAYTPEAFKKWAPYNVDKTVYIYNWGWYKVPGYFGPCRTPNYVVDQIRHFLKNRVVGIYICGGYSKSAYGMEGPALYAFGKALENPETEPKELLDDYVNNLFGEAAPPMRAFYRALYKRLESFSVFDRPNTEIGDTPNSLTSPVDYYCHCLPAKLINDMDVNLKRAEEMARDEKVKAVLKMVELEFNVVKSLATIYQLYRAYRASPNQAVFDELGKKLAEHKKMIDTLYDQNGKFINKYPKGLPLLMAKINKGEVLKGGRSAGVVNLKPPFTWDFKYMKEKGILPGTGKTKRVEAKKVKSVIMKPDLNTPAWKSVPFNDLCEISLGKVKNPSRFKMLYDDKAVYFGVECDYSSAKWLDIIEETGRDGNAWAQECIELAIDPYGQREKHWQFVFCPVPNSTYDARINYYDDPLHPLYGKRDAAWNGEWDYVAKIDKEKKMWTGVVRIPFKTLDVKPPEAGTLWTVNVGRAEWPEGRRKGAPSPIYSTWCPNLESRSFHDRATFGEAVFK